MWILLRQRVNVHDVWMKLSIYVFIEDQWPHMLFICVPSSGIEDNWSRINVYNEMFKTHIYYKYYITANLRPVKYVSIICLNSLA